MLLLAAAALVAGCASSEPEKPKPPQADRDVSTLPWNRPQNWEGKGVLGGITQ
jgi:hypothetical protein